jgi:hypothetical protein
MQFQRAVRLATMQKDRHGCNRDVRHDQRSNYHLPDGCVRKTIRKKVEDQIQA